MNGNSFDKAKKRLRDLFLQSVEMHLRSDVAVGAALSGGIDSSITVATMAHLLDTPVKTFSIGFKESLRRALVKKGIPNNMIFDEEFSFK